MEEINKNNNISPNLLCLKCGNLVGLINDINTYDCSCGNSTDFFKVSDAGALQTKERKIFFIIGPTGAGKSYLTKKLKALDFENVPSVTTRPLRKEETEEDYINISQEEMDKLKGCNNLCEYIKFGFFEYGVSKNILLDKIWNSDKNLILIVEPNGYEQMLIWFSNNHILLGNLNFKFYSVFLNIDRVTRFFNLLENSGYTGMHHDNSKNLLHMDVVINKETQTEDYLKFSKLLDRMVRNGDNMVELFESKKSRYNDLYELALKDKKIIINCIEITTRNEIDDFIIDLNLSMNAMNDTNGTHDIIKGIDNINEPETLKYLLNMIQSKLVSIGTERK